MVDEDVTRGRNKQQGRGALLSDKSQSRVDVGRNHHGTPRQKVGKNLPKGIGVVEGEGNYDLVFRRNFQIVSGECRACKPALVGVHHPLWRAGGTTGIGDGHDLIRACARRQSCGPRSALQDRVQRRSEEHTSELQSRLHLVCRLLLEKKRSWLDEAVTRLVAAVQGFPPLLSALLFIEP